MKKLAYLLLSSLLAILLTACFEIREEIEINPEGSGSYVMLVDMSHNKALIDAFLRNTGESNDEINKTKSELDTTLLKSVEKFNKIAGISNAKGIDDRQNYIFGVKFDFANVEALNEALKQTNQDRLPQKQWQPAYAFENKTLERKDNYYVQGLTDISKTDEGEAEKQEQIKNLLKDATYAYVVRTKGKIRKFSNKQSYLSADKKELRWSAKLQDVTERKLTIGNTIKIK